MTRNDALRRLLRYEQDFHAFVLMRADYDAASARLNYKLSPVFCTDWEVSGPVRVICINELWDTLEAEFGSMMEIAEYFNNFLS